ncbi:hypothetical protein CC78DRAFT_588236 [Lojkania enalia]|uniref:Large ribosomal subunit protein mL43 n=1 Tax=Lojkania enalia TaxID=147567 RepID=A0A9P4MWY3_9PLEO|nr:hypothetical protein CC78DRAFT_588236 [Didymosphaeria enalia]
MPLSAIKTVSKAQNGVGAFILPLRRLDLHYCDWAGSSRGMNAYLRNHLSRFASSNPQIEIRVSPKPHRHPVIIGHYINSRRRAICVKNLQVEGVREKVEYLRNHTGEKNRKIGWDKVRSLNESVRGVWSPFHGARIRI